MISRFFSLFGQCLVVQLGGRLLIYRGQWTGRSNRVNLMVHVDIACGAVFRI